MNAIFLEYRLLLCCMIDVGGIAKAVQWKQNTGEALIVTTKGARLQPGGTRKGDFTAVYEIPYSQGNVLGTDATK